MAENDFEYIFTERLQLRKVTPEVLNFVFTALSNHEQMAFFGFQSPEELEIENKKFLKGICTHNKSFCYFQLIDRELQNIIGWCGFHTWYLDHFRAEIGYGLSSDEFKNNGIMSEAMKEIIRFGFSEMKLNRIEAFISPQNIPSIKLARRFGFKSEGCLKNHYLSKGVFEDSEVFGLLKSEYDQKK